MPLADPHRPDAPFHDGLTIVDRVEGHARHSPWRGEPGPNGPVPLFGVPGRIDLWWEGRANVWTGEQEVLSHGRLTEIHDTLIRWAGGSAIIGVERAQALKGRDELESLGTSSQKKKEIE